MTIFIPNAPRPADKKRSGRRQSKKTEQATGFGLSDQESATGLQKQSPPARHHAGNGQRHSTGLGPVQGGSGAVAGNAVIQASLIGGQAVGSGQAVALPPHFQTAYQTSLANISQIWQSLLPEIGLPAGQMAVVHLEPAQLLQTYLDQQAALQSNAQGLGATQTVSMSDQDRPAAPLKGGVGTKNSLGTEMATSGGPSRRNDVKGVTIQADLMVRQKMGRALQDNPNLAASLRGFSAVAAIMQAAEKGIAPPALPAPQAEAQALAGMPPHLGLRGMGGAAALLNWIKNNPQKPLSLGFSQQGGVGQVTPL